MENTTSKEHIEYYKELIKRINNPNKWPAFEKPGLLDKLDEIAETSLSKNTIEGYLAAILLYQQLTEEVIRLFLKDHQFFIQLQVLPAKVTFSSNSKSMFGKIIESLKDTITFPDSRKSEIIHLANKINSIRIEIVHGLTKIRDLKNIRKMVIEVKSCYDKLFEIFDEEHDSFRVTFSQFKKNGDFESFLEDMELELQINTSAL